MNTYIVVLLVSENEFLPLQQPNTEINLHTPSSFLHHTCSYPFQHKEPLASKEQGCKFTATWPDLLIRLIFEGCCPV